MHIMRLQIKSGSLDFLRAGGGDPDNTTNRTISHRYSPHGRGWSWGKVYQVWTVCVLPAWASTSGKNTDKGFPRHFPLSFFKIFLFAQPRDVFHKDLRSRGNHTYEGNFFGNVGQVNHRNPRSIFIYNSVIMPFSLVSHIFFHVHDFIENG